MQRALLTPRAGPPAQARDLLRGCDEVIRGRLSAALADGRVTSHGLALLRDRYGLTPAETNVFVDYYLSCPGTEGEDTEPKRRVLARDLNLSENTLMHHITSIRRKLGLVSRAGSVNVFLWCLMTGITNVPPVQPVSDFEPVG